MEWTNDLKPMELVLLKSPATSYQDLMEAQKDLFQSQIVKFQNIVANQCKLTGVNPLSQEMAAGALSIKIGKRPRDLLNPKAIKYMQFVFSIKDAVSKRETREISTQFGVTATQVRDFFTSQRSRVRNFIRLSGDRTGISSARDKICDGALPSALGPDMDVEPVPIDTIVPATHDEEPSQSMHPEVLSGKEKSDKDFMDSIFHIMRHEESFAGQVKLLEWILQMEKTSVLQWFLAQGGVLILTTWLSQAAIEEQTTVLHIILKVLCHLPLRKALPAHMSAILQSVNRLRFYRVPDISKKARILLFSWSKMFANKQNSNKSNGIKSLGDAQDEMLLKQSINEVMGTEAWESDVGFSEAAPKLLSGNPDKLRKLEFPQNVKFLTASGEGNSKKRGLLSSQLRERRKVKMVEPLGQRGVGGPHASKLTPATQSRPLSADDIQKAKIRAQFLRSKYGRNDDNALVKSQSQPNYSSQSSLTQGALKSFLSDPDEQRRPDTSSFNEQMRPDTSPFNEHDRPDTLQFNEQKKPHTLSFHVPNECGTAQLNAEEPPWKKVKGIHNTWQTPPVIEIRSSWLVGTGESSKEVEIQKNRIQRERETVYRTIQEIPSNPRDPWDCEIDFDDTLTPKIPMEQLPDIDALETPQICVNDRKESIAVVAASTTLNVSVGSSVPGPDLELLAELLKNPEIVFALTSGQAGGLSINETVKLLDRIKTDGVISVSNLSGLNGRADNKVEVSLPSPTPSTEPIPNGVKPDFLRNPFARHLTMANGIMHQAPDAAVSIQSKETIPPGTYVHPHILTSPLLVSHPQPLLNLQLQTSNSNMLHQSSNVQHLLTDAVLSTNIYGNSNHVSHSLHQADNFGNINSSTASIGISQSRHLGTATPPRLLAPNLPQLPITQQASVSHSFRGMQSYNSINCHQNNSTQKIRNVYDGGSVMAAVPRGGWERKEFAERPEYESWSPENSPHRRDEYMRSQNCSEQRVSSRHGQAIQKERPLHSGFRNPGTGGAANKNSWDARRLH